MNNDVKFLENSSSNMQRNETNTNPVKLLELCFNGQIRQVSQRHEIKKNEEISISKIIVSHKGKFDIKDIIAEGDRVGLYRLDIISIINVLIEKLSERLNYYFRWSDEEEFQNIERNIKILYKAQYSAAYSEENIPAETVELINKLLKEYKIDYESLQRMKVERYVKRILDAYKDNSIIQQETHTKYKFIY